MKKNPDTAHSIITLDSGRLVSSATAWWVARSPNGYTYYCIHDKLLDVPCNRCERGIMRFERKKVA
jgi:hypothetical protein